MKREELEQYLSYDENTGEFVWIKSTSKRIKVGDVAGSDYNGSTLIVINKRRYMAHLYVTGEWPEFDIKHTNGFKYDNRFSNLKLGTRKR